MIPLYTLSSFPKSTGDPWPQRGTEFNDNMENISEKEDYGRRLLPQVVENAAKKNPDRVAYSFPLTDDPAEGFHDITNKRYANGVNRTAWWIERCFGKPKAKSFPCIGYIGPSMSFERQHLHVF